MAKTPMMLQYLAVKEQYKDAILFYRLGDFYEMFFDDAIVASRELELTLTGRDCGEKERAPMCGVPYHAAENYVGKLVARGYKVVICEQTEDPALAKGLVKRDVVRIVTPGTVTGALLTSEDKNNYLCTIYFLSESLGAAFADISTGDVFVTEITGAGYIDELINTLGAYSPSEIVTNGDPENYPALDAYLKERLHAVINSRDTSRFEPEKSKLLSKVGERGDMRIAAASAEMSPALYALLDYIFDTQKCDSSYIKDVKVFRSGQYLEMDINTRRNLELTGTMRTGEKKGSLLGVLDRTLTSMGSRLLRSRIEMPSVSVGEINRRLDATAELFGDFSLREELSEQLKGASDLERLMSKIVYRSASARDLRSLCNTLKKLPALRSLLSECESSELSGIYKTCDELFDICTLLDGAIVEEPPFSVREGGFIAKGYNAEVDRLNDILSGGKSIITDIETREKESTGIKNMKIGYNRVFGYYIEVSKSNIKDVPDSYIRRQTLTNGERYITEELKNAEQTILGASDRVCALEYNLFCSLCEKLIEPDNVKRIQTTATLLASLDVYLALAETAVRNDYIRPEVDPSDIIEIKDGRHPVVERFAKDGVFVPNDTSLDTSLNRVMLITGPNMAGKSTYMRQVALITVMAQCGSFVPAREARIGICDKVFTRVGASDDLASGQSTFMLEMNEVAYILKAATRRSLIIYDEIGRGTSTFDGMSIARAVLEYTAGSKIGAKTLFATHYHELTDLEGKCPGVGNYNIAAKKRGDDVLFLRKIVKGRADDSYGIEVAKLAGVPTPVIRRAKEVLSDLEAGGLGFKPATEPDNGEITLEDISDREIGDRLRELNTDTLTPIEALNLIYELKKMLM